MIELVWDAKVCGTATAPSGASATVGESASFTPDDLVAMAAAACLMRTFLRLAADAGVSVLSYASTGHMDDTGDARRVHVRSFIVGSDTASDRQLSDLAAEAHTHSPIAQLLGDRLRTTAEVRVLRGAAPAAAT